MTSLAAVVLEGLDNAWDPLPARLAGLTEHEYAWEPVPGCWSVRAPGDGGAGAVAWAADWADPDPVPAPVTTIAWRCWHVAVDCLDSYSARLFGATGTGLTRTAWVGTWAEAGPLLDASWSVFRAGVAAADDAALDRPLGSAWGPYATASLLQLVVHAQREIVHHGAEMALLRDLYGAGLR